MIVETQVTINGSKAAVWDAITDIENAATRLSGIEKIEVVERPPAGIVGLRWRETRDYFGKPATVEIWVTEAVENEFYKTRAESDGFLFLSTLRLSENGGGVTLSTSHDYVPQSFVAKVKSAPMFLFKGMIKKALTQDLTDIKTAVERDRSVPFGKQPRKLASKQRAKGPASRARASSAGAEPSRQLTALRISPIPHETRGQDLYFPSCPTSNLNAAPRPARKQC
jgi:hypothetical protein